MCITELLHVLIEFFDQLSLLFRVSLGVLELLRDSLNHLHLLPRGLLILTFRARSTQHFVAGIADTSSDAPDAHYKPKRNLYAQMQEQEAAARSKDADEGDSA